MELMKKDSKLRYPFSSLTILLAGFSLGTLILIFGQIFQQTQLRKKASGPALPPLKVKITNIYPKGFTVTWLTLGKTNGAVVFGDNRETVEKQETVSLKKEDERGSQNFSVHSVKVDNLQPSKRYFFKIISGDRQFYKSLAGEWQEAGVAESVSLPAEFTFSPSSPLAANNAPGAFSIEQAAFNDCLSLPGSASLPCFRPNPIYGQVTNEDGSAAEEALVYLEIPGKSNLLSTVSGEQGLWTAEMANFLSADLSGYLSYQPKVDLLKISSLGPLGSESSLYRSIPPVSQTFQDKTNPVVLLLPVMPTLTPTITPEPTATPTSSPSSPANTPTPTIVPTRTPTKAPAATATELTLKINLQEWSGEEEASRVPIQNGLLTVSAPKTTTFSRRLAFFLQPDGTYQAKITFLKPGTYSFSLKPNYYLKKTFPQVKISAGKNLLDLNKDQFLAGDLNNDNIINSLDFSLLLKELNPEEGKSPAVSPMRLKILLANYRKQGDK